MDNFDDTDLKPERPPRKKKPAPKKPGLVDRLIKNPDLARILCVAIAAEAKRSDEPVDSKALAVAFSRITHSLNRRTFAAECRQLERLGPDRYLKTAGDLITK